MIEKNRMLHSIGVVQYMYDNAETYGLNPDYMFLLGLLHDIGYIRGCKEGHELYGSILFDNFVHTYSKENLIEFKTQISDFIKEHATLPSDYLETNKNIPRELFLLWKADMSVDGEGNLVSFDERLQKLAIKYGKDSSAYRKCEELIEWLKKEI